MELEKKKYKKEEVEELLKQNSQEYVEIINNQKERIETLKSDNQKMSDFISVYKEKNGKIASVLTDAEEVADKIIKRAQKKFELEKEKIEIFSIRLQKYIEYLRSAYGDTAEMQLAEKTAEKIKQTLALDSEKMVEKSINILNESNHKDFNPKQKMQEYVSATGGNGFNLDEVLNPGELELGDICKELGLMDQKE